MSETRQATGSRAQALRHSARPAHVSFCERLDPSAEHIEDLEAARWVTRFQSGDHDAFTSIYQTYFDRVYGYLRVALKDSHEAESAAQDVFMRLFEKLPAYELRAKPFRHWLFAVARNYALSSLRKTNRLDLEDHDSLERLRDRDGGEHSDQLALGWISDADLLLFIERLPLIQRQVLTLRHMMGLSHNEIANLLGRTPTDIKTIHHRAILFLRNRLTAVGRGASGDRRRARAYQVFRQAHVLRHRRFALH
jgi:RNA polymerase sigma-70 factor (ECF subfamily)